jgi:hypothetical protein
MMKPMFMRAGYDLQVLWSVVRLVAIAMMYDFTRTQSAIKHGFGYEAMFVDKASTIC